jgi:hypothetical protein
MVKAGLIVAGVMLVLGTPGAWFLAILCVPCLALFAGSGGGYLAGQFDRPTTNSLAVRSGAGAGLIGGAGALLAHLIGGVLASVTLGPEGGADFARSLGLDPGNTSASSFYASSLGFACCLGVFEIVLLAGLGALGGLLWYQISGKRLSAPVAL